jgi:hypothetical protein
MALQERQQQEHNCHRPGELRFTARNDICTAGMGCCSMQLLLWLLLLLLLLVARAACIAPACNKGVSAHS